MTEIQFILKLMTEHKLSPKVKELCLARIGEVEGKLAAPAPAPVIPQRPMSPMTHIPVHMEVPPQAIALPARGQDIMVNNGDGTRGKRKF